MPLLRFILFFSAALLCLARNLEAQKLLLGPREDLNVRQDDFSVIGSFKEYTAVYRKHDRRAEIILYNADMVRVRSLPLDAAGEDFSRIHFNATADRIMIFFQRSEDHKEVLYGQVLNAKEQFSEPQRMLSVSVNGSSGIKYLLESSENGTRHLLYSSYYNDGAWVLQAKVIDADLQRVSEVNQLLGTSRDWILADRVAVSNAGEALLCFTEKPSSKGATEAVKLLLIVPGFTECASFPLPLNKHAVSDLWPICDNGHGLFYIGGFYADGRYNSPKGVFFSTFDPVQKTSTASHFSPISMQGTGGKSDLRDFRMRLLSIKTDGGAEILTEKYFQQVRTISSINPTMSMGFMTVPDQARTINEFFYDEVVVFNLKPDGNLGWSQTLLKEQQSSDDGGIYSSIGVLEHRAGKVVLFSDLNSRQSRLMAGFVAHTGDVVMRELPLGEEALEWNWMPRSARQVSKSEIVMPCTLKGYLCFLKIRF